MSESQHVAAHREAFYVLQRARFYIPRAHPSRKEGEGFEVWRLDQICTTLKHLIQDDFNQRAADPHLNIEDGGDLLTITEWLKMVREGSLIDDDGSGYLATNKEESDVPIQPSDITHLCLTLPSWATHVRWYNK